MKLGEYFEVSILRFFAVVIDMFLIGVTSLVVWLNSSIDEVITNKITFTDAAGAKSFEIAMTFCACYAIYVALMHTNKGARTVGNILLRI